MSDTNSVASLPKIPKRRAVLLFVVLALIILGGISLLALTTKTSPRTITTLGLGKKTFPTSSASITFVYYTQGTDKGQTDATGKAEFARLITTIQGMGVTSLSQGASQVVPVASTTGGTTTYQYGQGGVINVSTLAKINVVLQTLQSMPNVLVAQTSFLPSDEAAASSDLFTAAMQDAKGKATTLAQLSKGHLGKVISASEVTAAGDTTQSTVTKTGSGTSLMGTTDFSNIELQKSIAVTFELQ